MWFSKKELAKIVFSSDYIYGLPTTGEYQTFDILKYKKIRDRLIQKKALKHRNILRPHPCSYEELRLVHDEKYLKRLQDPQYVSHILKIDIAGLWDNYIMEYYRAVTGGTLMATAYTLSYNKPVFNLGGGYHHAHPDRAEGFCLINDVAISIEKFRRKKQVNRFMIIDLDYHQGNGNLLYFRKDQNVYTFSIHADTWVDVDESHNKDILIDHDCDDETYLRILKEELGHTFEYFHPELVFYIAGSDTYEKDTIAGLKLTRQGMLDRNLFVFRKVRQLNLPMVILAGGGYGPESWQVYYDFIEYCITNKVTYDGLL